MLPVSWNAGLSPSRVLRRSRRHYLSWPEPYPALSMGRPGPWSWRWDEFLYTPPAGVLDKLEGMLSPVNSGLNAIGPHQAY